MAGEFTTYDSEKIYYQSWTVDCPKAVIQIYHGLGEMEFYYTEFAQKANLDGISVYLHEYRAHGRTAAGFNEADIFSQYIKDALIFHTVIQRENPGIPVFLLAHSVGTEIAQGALYQYPEFYEGAILTGMPDQSFGEELLHGIEREIRENGPDAPNIAAAMELFGHVNDDYAEENSTLAWLTSDSAKRDFYEALPYTNVSYSNRFYRDMVLYQEQLKVQGILQIGRKELPLLILTGGEDLVSAHGTYGAKIAEQLKKNGFSDVTERTYPGYRHSILQETGRDKVEKDIFNWIGRHL